MMTMRIQTIIAIVVLTGACEAAEEPLAPATPRATEIIPHPSASGSGEGYSYQLTPAADVVPCGPKPKEASNSCQYYTLNLANDATDTLECVAKLTGRAATFERRKVLTAHESAIYVVGPYPPSPPPVATVRCNRRAPVSPLVIPPECKHQILKFTNRDDFYPGVAQHLEEEGSVDMEYALSSAEGTPTDIKVIGSSLYSDLDLAAINSLRGTVMSTNCPGQRFRMRQTFKLKR